VAVAAVAETVAAAEMAAAAQTPDVVEMPAAAARRLKAVVSDV
jgi:hypothetical protein